ncbi:MAG: single-stranded DNA-binding protein [Candidatus Dadabacteria bacterium]|nr:MAG: single-stranded DNA-binding protein [Candidatus Dadabacteria bacterium]
MTRSLNKIMIIGNLGADPDIRVTQSGTKVANLRVATSERWTDRNGAQQEHTEWHRVVFYGNLAEICEKYLSKGRRVYVEGSIRTDKWTDRDGNDRYTTEIRGRDMIMLDGRGDGGGFAGGQDRQPQSSGGYQAPPELADDDIPF